MAPDCKRTAAARPGGRRCGVARLSALHSARPAAHTVHHQVDRRAGRPEKLCRARFMAGRGSDCRTDRRAAPCWRV